MALKLSHRASKALTFSVQTMNPARFTSKRHQFVARSICLSQLSTQNPVSIVRSRLPMQRLHRYSTQPSSNKRTPKTAQSEKNESHSFNQTNYSPDILSHLKSLRMSRTTKVIVYTALAIVGTMETVFWIKVLWTKFGSGNENSTEERNGI
ncbi:hypothetical protein BGW36DRAFT_355770 [Talaromyces proteolyticus]|uniref:Uncharacterized protein n=1 Tax=Talaromyces proteolyticus TaxID=1131652 RepID=A0AAD4Q3C1_9EURO|nr:uncharacterized protein BGW36DRAFT_355770 [Talaromyces proteolyticus]KAH8701616.1 hypothetical protein BGW36DRAFT_355770 [Talaromyces proteolyticus]